MSDDEKILDYLKQVTVELHDTRARLMQREEREREPIAIVGMGCRYPGGVSCSEDLWRLVADGRDAIGDFPMDRGWDLEGLFHPDPDKRGTTYAREGGFIDRAGEFDAGFFRISPREAMVLDPQQRLLLEVSWEALEDAGIDPAALRGSPTGVYAGVMYHDYATTIRGPVSVELEASMGAGVGGSLVSGRIAYTLGLEGPAVSLDTACSSSLVALHLACQALHDQGCSLALVGGVTVMWSPGVFVGFSRQRGLARDGRCKAYDDSADGTGWGEGAGMIVLERLSDAEKHGHEVLALVRGSAINQDGASNGLTAPNGPSQQRVIRAALLNAGCSPGQVDLVEGHGTGTALGDPIEAQALLATYGQAHTDEQPLWLGSIKSNIGHTQSAAGVAGVIKAVMAMRHRHLPKTLHVEEPSREVDWSSGAVALLREAAPWPEGDTPRRAGVSSFGASGTNAHVILEEAPVIQPGSSAGRGKGDASASSAGSDGDRPGTATGERGRRAGVWAQDALTDQVARWPISAKDETGLVAQAVRLWRHVETGAPLSPIEMAYSLAHRPVLERRAVLAGGSQEELLARLEALCRDGSAPGMLHGEARRGASGQAVFVFSGQGGQWDGMARELMRASPVFSESMGACAEALAPFIDWSLQDAIEGRLDAASLARLEVVQPLLFAMMASLSALWRACGVVPAAVVGHSQGEIAAAYVAGALSLEDAARIVALRSRILAALQGQGAMMSIAAPHMRVMELIEGWEGRIGLAGVNGPRSMVLVGDNEALSELVGVCDAEGISTREVKNAQVPSHSPRVEPLREELLEALRPVAPRAGDVGFCSTVTGGLLDGRELGAEYWYRNLREPVQFEPAVRGLLEHGYRTFVEVGAHPVLTVAVQDTIDEFAEDDGELAEEPGGAIGTLRRDQGGPERFLTSLAEAWVRGIEVDWKAVLGDARARRVSLPAYPFKRDRYWIEPPTGKAEAELSVAPANLAEATFWEAVESGDPRQVATALGIEQDVAVESLVELLPTLSDWRGRVRTESRIDSWRYRVDWTPIGNSASTLSGQWLLAVPEAFLGDEWALALAAALASNGAEVVPVTIDDAASVDCQALVARLQDALLAPPEDMLDGSSADASVASSGDAPTGRRVAGVLSLLSLDERRHSERGGLSIGVAATLTLVQALETAGIEGRLWLATREAVSVGAGDPLNSPLQGIVWGLGCTLGLEQPNRWGGIVDLPEKIEDRSLTRLCGLLAEVDGEDQLALRPAGVFARRLRHAPAGDEPASATWRPNGTALVTGGTGEIGSHVARWLALAGVPHLLLASRRGPDAPGATELAAELQALGARVSVVACDVSDRAALQELFASIPEEHPLDAVFHVAAAGTACTLDTLTLDQLEATLAPKANAALHLHELTEQIELSAFVLFSSMGATMGSGGQGDRVAADALLDALAAYRRARGLPATSVAWGPWVRDGMAEPAEQAIARRGVLALEPQLALDALRGVLDREETCVTVASVDWERYASTYTLARARPLIGELPEVRRLQVESETQEQEQAQESGALAARLAPLDASKRERVALELVREHSATAFGYARPDMVESGKAFKELGADSLMALDLRKKLAGATGLRLPSTLLFDHPTPAALAKFLVDEAMGEQQEQRPATSTAVGSEDPIAIVGMSCRYPGEVRSPRELWELVAAGRDAIGGFPTDRGWNLEGLYDPDPNRSGTSYVREGGFLEAAGDFDAGFFGINPREALAMDPQQRMLLEGCWEALEDAALDPAALRGSETGVYVGCGGQDYSAILFEAPTEELAGYRVAGGMASMTSGRVAYTFGLEGPAVSVDTACSSSLVALHLGCQALRSGECSLALVAGVTVMSTPVLFVEASRQRGLAPDGRCKAFADGADGTSFSDGVGVLTIERLSDARRLGHEVLAIVRGSAVNQDGASNGLTAPSGPSQERVVRQALANAGLAPDEVDAVEAHGTGTSLGDPIEAHALLATYGQGRSEDRPLWLGSIKSNIGHTAAAAGVAGVIKMTMALRNDMLPRTLHAQTPSRHIDWSAGSVSLLSEERPWQRNGRPRRAGISSFGASGTNAHVIVEEAPFVEPSSEIEGGLDGGIGEVLPWILSGKGYGALCGQAERLAAHVCGSPDLDVADVGFSLVGRPAFEDRALVLGDGREGLLNGLGALTRGEPGAGVIRGAAHRDSERVAFLFPGQGSQWEGMAVELLDSSPVFAERIGACGEALTPFVDWSLEDVLRGVGGAPELDRLDVVQPVLFSVMVSLAALWQSFGVVPDVVLGHSQGEIAAAAVAGALSLQDAARIVALRSRIQTTYQGHGGMLSIAAPRAQIDELLERWEGRIFVAAINGPRSMVLACEGEELSELVQVCEAEGIRARMIKGARGASHSPQMESLREELLEALDPIVPRANEVELCSSVTGGLLDGRELGAEYWYRNVREPVRFEPAVRGLLERGQRTFIEVSAHPVVAVPTQDTIEELARETDEPVEDRAGVIGSLRRDQGGMTRFLTSLGEAWVRGVEVDWGKAFGETQAKRVGLPTYAFQRERYWFDAGAGAQRTAFAGFGEADYAMSSAVVGGGEPAETLPLGVLAVRMAQAPEDRRHATALEFVLGEVAAVLGYSSPQEIDAKRAFLELGFDSLTALELRNRLSAATRLQLPNALVLDHPTSSATAAYIVEQLADVQVNVVEDEGDARAEGDGSAGDAYAGDAQAGGNAHGVRDTRTGGDESAGDPSAGILTTLFREAHEQARIGEFIEMLASASRFRARFDASDSDRLSEPVRLCEGAGALKLVCFPSVLAMSGPHEYVRFTKGLDGSREVSVLPALGYASGQRLPQSFEVMAQTQAEAVARHVADAPFALMGYSSGGIVAHAVASRLEEIGVCPSALVLIDTYPFDMKALFELTGTAFRSEGASTFINDVRLTAMGAYLDLLAGWGPSEIATPLLLAKASEPVPGVPAQSDLESSWNVTHSAIEIPGHHFTIMQEHADATAQAVEGWLSTTCEGEKVIKAC
ncbi:MAG: SDR family NAD(P)-dependent oxidoreductase [Solirubrobacteraceae bacterium]